MKNKIVLELIVEDNQIQSVEVHTEEVIKAKNTEEVIKAKKRNHDQTTPIASRDRFIGSFIGINEIAMLFGVTTWTINDWIRSSIFPRCNLIIRRKPFWIREIILPEIQSFLKFRNGRSKINIRLEYLNYIKQMRTEIVKNTSLIKNIIMCNPLGLASRSNSKK